MRVLLVCAMGMSTSILMKKMEAYWANKGEDNEIAAVGVNEIEDVSADYDVILVGPQMSYRMDEVASTTGKPCASIPPADYGLANCANIDALAKRASGIA